MAAIHRLKIDSDILKTGAVSPELVEELFRTVDESISYEIEVAGGTAATTLPGIGTGATQIQTIQSFVLITDTSVTLGWNSANTSLVVASGNRRAVFVAYGITYDTSSLTAPTIANSGTATATIQVMLGGT